MTPLGPCACFRPAGRPSTTFSSVRDRTSVRTTPTTPRGFDGARAGGEHLGGTSTVRDPASSLVDGAVSRIEHVLDMSRDAFVETDADGVLTEWNRQSEVLFGWSRDEVLGRPITEFLIPERHQRGGARTSSSRRGRSAAARHGSGPRPRRLRPAAPRGVRGPGPGLGLHRGLGRRTCASAGSSTTRTRTRRPRRPWPMPICTTR